jgi:hypothetical protein
MRYLRNITIPLLKNQNNFSKYSAEYKYNPYICSMKDEYKNMEKVSLAMYQSLIDEHKALLVKYSGDEIALKEIKKDIDSLNSVCVILGVRGLVKFDRDIF